jgi:hypothetical protein
VYGGQAYKQMEEKASNSKTLVRTGFRRKKATVEVFVCLSFLSRNILSRTPVSLQTSVLYHVSERFLACLNDGVCMCVYAQDRKDSSSPEMLNNIWNQKETPPHFFIDGYNIIGYWVKLKKRRDKGDMQGARDALFESVCVYACVCVCLCRAQKGL